MEAQPVLSPLAAAAIFLVVTVTSGGEDTGYPIREHLARLVSGEIIWAPAPSGAFVPTGRGGDYELHLGQELSIGYASHASVTRQSQGPGR